MANLAPENPFYSLPYDTSAPGLLPNKPSDANREPSCFLKSCRSGRGHVPNQLNRTHFDFFPADSCDRIRNFTDAGGGGNTGTGNRRIFSAS